jgi:arylsulfatase A-like enzyme
MWDTVRADHLSIYGYDKATTPRMAERAKGATGFEKAWAPGTWTVPSHASMFTGLHTTTHGAHAAHRWLDGHHQTLAERLGDGGYDTFAFSSNVFASPVSNLLQGFDVLHTTYPRGKKPGRYQAAARKHTIGKLIAQDASTEISPAFGGSNADKWAKSVFKDASPVVAKGLLDWLDERPSEAPWFAYLNMMEAHTPRIPSLASRQAMMDEDLQAHALTVDASLFAENSFIVGQRTYDDKDLAAIRGVYDAAVRDLDMATADLMEALKTRGVLDDTIVILVSDHGESLGEHRMMEHRWAIHEPLLSVPLIVRYPNKLPPARVATPVSTIDVFNTVLDLTGQGQADDAGVHSKSLRMLADRGPIFAELVDPYASQMKSLHKAYPQLDMSKWLRTYSAVRDGDHKYVAASDDAHELYNLEVDPGELNNLLAAEAQQAERLSEAVSHWHEGLPEYDPNQATSADRGGDAGAEERAQLIMLGYIDGDEEDE